MTTSPTTPGGHNKLTGDLFDKEAANYDRLRPSYPEQLFDLLIEKAGLAPGAMLLEVGPGSGQATLPMAERGFLVTAVEPGVQLAEITRRKLQPYPNSQVQIGKFEDAEPHPESFDLVYGATSLHWVDSEVLFEKAYKVLKPGGHLAIIYNELVEMPQDKPFYDLFEPIVLGYGVTSVFRAGTTPDTMPDGKPPVKTLDTLESKFEINELFEDAGFFINEPSAFTYPTTNDYLNYLKTISHVAHLPDDQREAFLAEVRNLVDTQFGGKITLHFAATLQLARKKTPQSEESGASEKP